MTASPSFLPRQHLNSVLVLDLARLIVAFAPQSLHTDTVLGDRFMDALLRASDWDEHWTPPMTKPKERNILLLLRTIANALQEGAEFEKITWALKVLVIFFVIGNMTLTSSDAPTISVNRCSHSQNLFRMNCLRHPKG